MKELVSPQTRQSGRICAHFPSGNHQNHNQVLNSLPPKTLESTPHDIFKDNEGATRDGRRGAFTTQSKPMSTRWAAHRLQGNYITEVPSQDGVLSPTSRSPAWRSSPARRDSRAFGLEGQWDWVQDWSSTGLGETESTLGGHRQGFVPLGWSLLLALHSVELSRKFEAGNVFVFGGWGEVAGGVGRNDTIW